MNKKLKLFEYAVSYCTKLNELLEEGYMIFTPKDSIYGGSIMLEPFTISDDLIKLPYEHAYDVFWSKDEHPTTKKELVNYFKQFTYVNPKDIKHVTIE